MPEKFIISRPELPPIALAMTEQAFGYARRANIAKISPCIVSLRRIALELGSITDPQAFPPTFFVVRHKDFLDLSPAKVTERLPFHRSMPSPRFVAAGDLLQPDVEFHSRDALAKAAQDIGASALIEVKIGNWHPSHYDDITKEVTVGMATRNAALELPVWPKVILSAMGHAFHDRFGKAAKIGERLAKAGDYPFTFAYTNDAAEKTAG